MADMGQILRRGVAPGGRGRAVLILLAGVAGLVILKMLGWLPGVLDELPQHSNESSIDKLGDAGKAGYDELVPVDIWLNALVELVRVDLGFDRVTRFLSRQLKELINISNSFLLGGRKGFGLGGVCIYPGVSFEGLAFGADSRRHGVPAGCQ